MIQYEQGYLGVNPRLLITLSGSVVPKAMFWSLPCAGIAIGLWYYWGGDDAKNAQAYCQVWVGYHFILGFMIVFRMVQALRRFWEAATLTNELRADWIDAVQGLFAFCSPDPEKAKEVEEFQHYIIRLISMLHRAALERLNLNEDEEFHVIEHSGIDPEALKWLGAHPDRCEIIEQWIIRLIVKKTRSGLLSAPPPILNRCYGEISQGMLKLHSVMKISTIPIPFPYVQMSCFLLLLNWMLTPIIASLIMENERWTGILAFISVFCLWAIFYIAQEIEVPFGDHKNNLPCYDMQRDLNRILKLLLRTEVQTPPTYDFSENEKKIMFKKEKTARKTERQIMQRLSIEQDETVSSARASNAGMEGQKEAWGP
mmetsp:Transcript_83493/g.145128  ORF Transcript_83493/g.145128 Transcript_83493/m.145128 type:complete len:370 (+) Transcript_83493:62-1171(+)